MPGLLLPKDHIDDSNRDQHVYKAETLASLREARCKGREHWACRFEARTSLFKSLQDKSNTPFLSASHRFEAKKGPKVKRAMVHVLDGIKVGVTGVALDLKNSRAKISDEEKENLERELQTLTAEKVDVLILWLMSQHLELNR